MTNEDRAAQYVVLFNHYGDRWRANVPVDATVQPRKPTVHIGGMRLQRHHHGLWSVTNGWPVR